MVFATIHSPIVQSNHNHHQQQLNFESVPVEIPHVDYQKANKPTCQYFCVGTLDELEEKIRKHSEETFSHFVVAKKTKGFGATGFISFLFNSFFRIPLEFEPVFFKQKVSSILSILLICQLGCY